MKKRKILYISGSRADYGLMEATLLQLKNNPRLQIEIVATGMHLMSEFGKTINEIKNKGFKITAIRAGYQKDDKQSMAIFLGSFLKLLTQAIKKINPEIILLLGDRAEMLAGAITGAYLSIPVAHIHGGDISSTVDNSVRNAITKLAHIHFPATQRSAKKIVEMGEETWRVRVTGAPGLSDILNTKLQSLVILQKKYNLDTTKPLLLVIQHPVSVEEEDATYQMKETMEAIREINLPTIVVYPNADAGARKMIEVIEQYRNCPLIKIYKNIGREDFINLIRIARVLVGNSSSGIIETPLLHLPVVNIGSRQNGREKAKNVIDVGYNRNEIKKAIAKAMDNKKFIANVKKCHNPYGNGQAGKIISKILCEMQIDKKLLQK
jgi:UDP-hydrolysing UDP-N-acetyl-D-glucosamine 2-epimerase